MQKKIDFFSFDEKAHRIEHFSFQNVALTDQPYI